MKKAIIALIIVFIGNCALAEDDNLFIKSGRALIFMPIRIKVSELTNFANSKVPSNIQESKNAEFTPLLKNDWVRYNIWRGQISLSAHDDRIDFSIPIDGSATAGGKFCPLPCRFCPHICTNVQQSVGFKGSISGGAFLRIASDWTPAPQPDIRIDFSQATMRIAKVVTVSVKDLLQHQVKPKAEDKFRQFANELVSGIKLREKADKLWDQLHFTAQLNNTPKTWIQFAPKQVMFGKVRTEQDFIISGIGVDGELSITVADNVAPIQKRPLPNLSVSNSIEPHLSLQIPVTAMPDELNRAAESAFHGFRYNFSNGYEFEILSVNLAAIEDRLLTTIDFRATKGLFSNNLQGKLSVSATPVFDPATQTLRAENMSYDIATKNAFVSAADWLLGPILLKELEKAAKFDFRNVLARAKNEADKKMAAFELPKGVIGTIQVKELFIDDIRVTGGHILSLIKAEGEISPVTIDP